MVLSLMIAAAGCGNNEPGGNPPDDPNKPLPDPIGTVTANISQNTRIDIPGIGSISWTEPDNFALKCEEYDYLYIVSICDLGEMKGLGNITNNPTTGFTVPAWENTAVACQSGHGYVVKFEKPFAATQYVRLYVAEPITSFGSSIIGAKVKYLYKFEETTLAVSTNLLSFTNAGGTQNITVTTNANDWFYSCNDFWVTATKTDNKLSVSVNENYFSQKESTVSIQVDGRQIVVPIKQAKGNTAETSAPYKVGDLFYENGITGVVFKISTDAIQGAIVSLDETSCAWSNTYEYTGCTYKESGVLNFAQIFNITNWESWYPAFKWCYDMNKNINTNLGYWYLPAWDELNELYLNKQKVNATLMLYNCPQISTDYYWTSIEYSAGTAIAQNFANSNFYGFDKKNSNKVRAIFNF